MTIQTQTIDYHDQNTALEAYLAYDDSIEQPMPAVLIAHAWAGREEIVCRKARDLAALGYAAFALDMYGKGIVGAHAEENNRLMQPFLRDRRSLQSRMQLALRTVRNLAVVDSSRVAAIGFCFGGLCVLDLARSGAEFSAAISFHGLFKPPGNTAGNKISAKILAFHGHDDPMVPIEDVVALQQELSEAGADWQIHVYGGTMHAFTHPEANDAGFGTVYNAIADRRSWQSLRNFLEEVFA